MDALNCGSTLGRYELLVRLGRGGMASVWVARELGVAPGEQRLVALKAMLPELAGSDFRSMFLEEGQIIRSIDHENVVKVHEVSEDRGVLFMAMEWVEGDSLRAVIAEARRRRPIPPEMAVKIIADAAAGLHAAHELRGWDGELRNVVHCDISPHNILVGLDGRAKIVDFGVAHASLLSELSAGDKVKGKYSYMSPEQARGERIDRRSDVFSLGIVLFELTTGERLFRGENPAHSLHLVTASAIPDPRQIRPEYPARLAQIVMRALERDPARRFPTAAALREALERYLVEERILVSHGSVAQLVRRVLGARIEQLRQSLREAIVVRDGVIAPDLIPDAPLVAGTFTELPSSNSRSSGYSASSRPQTYETPPQQRSGFFPLLAALTGIAAAASSIYWFTQRSLPAPLSLAVHAASSNAVRARAVPTSAGASAPRSGIDVSSLPVGVEATLAKTSARDSAPARSARRAERKESEAADTEAAVDASEGFAAEPGPQPAAPLPAPVPSNVPAPSSEPAEEVVLAETPPVELEAEEPPAPPVVERAPEPPPSERGPFNRGAAIAQLGSAASRAASCKRAGGPSGGGRAAITFPPGGGSPRVAIPAPFAGTPVGSCLNSVFGATRVPAFTGSAVTLPWSFRVPE